MEFRGSEMERNGLEMNEQLQKTSVSSQKSGALAAIEQNNRFLGNLAYQMRTALNAITGFSEILSMDSPRDDQKEHVYEINRASKGLTKLVNDVIEFTKIDGQLAKQNRECILDEIVEEIKSTVGFRAELKGIIFEIEKAENLPASIVAHSRYLKDCIIKLAESLIKFDTSEKVIIRIAKKADEDIEFRFDAKGVELDDHTKRELFEPFLDNLENCYRDIEDTGLTFPIASKLADSIGASLFIPEDGNSIFILNVPIGSPAGRSKLVDEYIKVKARNRNIQPKELDGPGRILVAEDNVSNQAVIEILLKRLGFIVDVVSNGKQAVKFACENDYDLILMDVKMPEMDGFSAATSIREKGILLPILALTAMDEAEVLDSEQGCHFDGQISKPIDAVKMETALSKYLISEQLQA